MRQVVGLVVLAALGAFLAACGTTSSSGEAVTVVETLTVEAGDTAPLAEEQEPPATTEEEPPPEEEPPAPEAMPDASFTSTCSYVLGDFSETAAGFRFVADYDIENTGNIGVVVKLTASWKQAGVPAIKASKEVKVAAGKTKNAGITRVGTQDEIDLHQATDQSCKTNAVIVDTFGEPK